MTNKPDTDKPDNTSNKPAPDPKQAATPKPEPSPAPSRGPAFPILMMLLVFIVATFGAGAMWGPSAFRWTSATIATNFGEGSKSEEGTWYTCGMHPWIIFPSNEQLCPICHMELTPIDPSKFSSEVTINPIVVQNIGIRIEPVTKGPVERTIRTVGTISFDETRVRDVNIKAEGWIEKLYVDIEGSQVEVGDPLFDEYSPTLYSAQSEYLSALRIHAASQPGSLIDTQRLVDDARIQLEYYDVTPVQIAALEESGEPSKTLTMQSPHSGIVIAKHANEGMLVNKGMRVYQIADLSKVWVMVSMFEYQLPFLKEGLSATMSLPYIPGQEFEGEITYIYPFLDEKTRQVRVRLEFDNPNQMLKPGMFANVRLTSTLARERTLAPRTAIIDTGERTVAFVSLGEGRFEPRDVRLGVETGSGQVEILDGLSPDEMVVVSGQFLLDSESRFRESLMKMIQGDLAADQEPVIEAGGKSALAELPDLAEEHINSALESYFAISEMLASDTFEDIADHAVALGASVDALLLVAIPDHATFWEEHKLARIKERALGLTELEDIVSARLAMADLSIAMQTLLSATGIPPSFETEVLQLHCPMYLEDQGGSVWLQAAGDIRNPYMGSAMLACFDTRVQMPVTGNAVDEDTGSDNAEEEGTNKAGDTKTPESPTTPSQQQALMATPIPDTTQEAVDRLYSSYIAIQEELTRDELDGLSGHVEAFTVALASLETSPPASLASFIETLRSTVDIDATDLETFRAGYRGLSDAMIAFARIAPPSANVAPAIYHAYCPMEKADWLQLGDEVANPYAPYMLRCGSIEETFTTNGSTR